MRRKTKSHEKLFQIFLTKKMKNEYNTQEAIYCEDDGEYRVYCNICDKLCIERLYKNHLKSRTHISNIRNKQQKIIEKFRRYIFISNTLILINI